MTSSSVTRSPPGSFGGDLDDLHVERSPQIATLATPGTRAGGPGSSSTRSSTGRSARRLRRDPDLHHPAGRRERLEHDRRRGPGGQRSAPRSHPLLDELAGADQIGARLKISSIARAGRPTSSGSRRAPGCRQRLLQRHRHELLDLGGVSPRPASGSRPRRRELGEHVDRHVPDAYAEQHHRRRRAATTRKRNLRLVETIQRIIGREHPAAGSRSRPDRHFPTPNSKPHSSAAPTVTTGVPAAGPDRTTATSPSTFDVDRLTLEHQRLRAGVHPRRAVGLVDDGVEGDLQSAAGAGLRPRRSGCRGAAPRPR